VRAGIAYALTEAMDEGHCGRRKLGRADFRPLSGCSPGQIARPQFRIAAGPSMTCAVGRRLGKQSGVTR